MLLLDFEKTLGRFQLRVKLEAGNEAVGVLGASGAGKSMTLKCIAGVEKPDAGRIVLDGKTLFDAEKGIHLPPQKRGVGLLFQHYALFPQMTVEQNIAAGLRKQPRSVRQETVHDLLGRFHLSGLEKRLPHQLSGGQQQRVALARMLAAQPQLLLFDEPFAALDSFLRWELEQVVAEVMAAHGGTALFVSHNRDEAYRLCQKLAILEQGQVSVYGEKEAVFARPVTCEAARLTGCKNIAEASVIDETHVEVPVWGLRLKVHGLTKGITAVGIRAHAIGKAGGENGFRAQVQQVIESPFSVIYMVQPEGAAQQLRWETGKQERLSVGEQVSLAVAAEDILLLQ